MISPKDATAEHRTLSLLKLLLRRKHTYLTVGLGIDRICVFMDGFVSKNKITSWRGFYVEWIGIPAVR